MAKQLIGIVIDNEELMMYQEQGSELVLTVEGIERDLINKGKIAQPEILAAKVADIKERDGFSGNDCVLVLPEYGVYFRNISLQPMTEAELKMNLAFEFKDYVGSDKDGYVYDYAMDEILYDAKDNPVEMKLFAAAARKEMIAEWADMMKMAGLKISSAIPREMCLVNIFRRAIDSGADPNKDYCLINIRLDGTIIYIVQDASLKSTRLIEYGSNSDNYDLLSGEIRKSLNFYSYENQGREIKDVYFCGSGSDSINLKATITSNLGLVERSLEEILPMHCMDLKSAYRGLLAIGALA
ncbi:MAG: pilus assembly protein PilM [Eubacteriales bacterium]|nr:pilus assembly protein PilM [Eubacteriales bacterium]